MADKLADYRAGRQAGLEMALKEVRENGVDGLIRLLQFYGNTKIPPAICKKDLEYGSEQIKTVTIDTLLIGACAILHDEFGFGKARIEKFIQGYNKIAAYLIRDWLDWYDLIDEIKARLDIDLYVKDGEFTTAPPDVDPEPDEGWEKLIGILGFTEEENPPKSNCYDILTDYGEWRYRYTTPEEKEKLFFWFSGILDERIHNEQIEQEAEKTAS